MNAITIVVTAFTIAVIGANAGTIGKKGSVAHVQSRDIISWNNTEFYVETVARVNWFQALSLCRSLSKLLVSFSSRAKYDAVMGYIQSLELAGPDFWTSGADLGEEGLHVWVNEGRQIPLTEEWWPAGVPTPDMNAALGENDCVAASANVRNDVTTTTLRPTTNDWSDTTAYWTDTTAYWTDTTAYWTDTTAYWTDTTADWTDATTERSDATTEEWATTTGPPFSGDGLFVDACLTAHYFICEGPLT